jgi:phosphate transport system protein
MATDHTVRSFDDDLKRLDHLIAEMGGLAEVQLAGAIEALVRRDVEQATAVAAADARIDALEAQLDQHTISLLARRQPMARDLREIVGALKTASMIERIGDYAKNIAKRTAAIAEVTPVPSVQSVARLGELAQAMVKDVLDAFLARDRAKADAIRLRDRDLDALHTAIFRELLTYMMEDPRSISACTHLLFVAKHLERIGDHATNIAEIVHFLVTGEAPTDQRPRGDESEFVIAEASARR